MPARLAAGPRVVGLKQSRRALESRAAAVLYLAGDADARLTEPLRALAGETGVTIVPIPTMAELGRACGISVGSAVAALLR